MQVFGFKGIFRKSGEHTERRVQRVQLPDNARVLIVDDSRTARAVIAKLLSSTGFEILEAESGEQGMEMAIEHKPDLILMDVIMPGMTGFQATRQLRKHLVTRHTPIIIISGNDQATEEFWSLRIGANGFLKKPLERESFFRLMEKVFDTRQVA